MNARAFLVRGLLVGLLAGLASFFVAHQVGEPHVETAIALEESGAAAAPEDAAHSHDDAEGDAPAGHSHSEDAGTEVSRDNQRTWGLLTGTLAIGVALGGLMALIAAGAVGRLGRLTPVQSTTLVAGVGFLAYTLVPFLKYPPNPPAVGSGDTIGARTADYFTLVGISVVAAIVAVVVAVRLYERLGAYLATAIAVVGYTAVAVVATTALPTVNEIGAFPADVLWNFRLASLFTLVTMWSVIGLGLTFLVSRLQVAAVAQQARRELVASL
ncbi:CbtA family protein [Nocardioides sp. R-C-SC26]|uniref:CbtA family protein n=1 Tax=Nocardioides sp. R-C-SC26 TaxID=2870414 RepID=UPI001E6438F3|nr:CbtA family protein [Nocardioides sp. R-C-SC26]